MNYALDALWWRLATPAVRDLAAVLTAPPLWDSGCELPVQTLLGGQGFRYLLALDEAPEPLHAYLQPKQPFSGRVGFYAEALLAFWLDKAPHCRLLAHNLPVHDGNGRTLGALDFMAGINGVLYHLELCCKYYGEDETGGGLCGLNRADRLADKAAKLAVQTAWTQTPQGAAALRGIGVNAADVRRASVVRGTAFLRDTPSENAPLAFGLHPGAWTGVYLDDWTAFAGDQPDGARYAVLPRMDYLAPARLAAERSVGLADIAAENGILFARLERRPDGFWHEVRRFMKR